MPRHTAVIPTVSRRPTGPRTARDAIPDAPAPTRSLYLHVPFCAHKCHYCDFYSFVGARDRQDEFADALIAELRSLAPPADPSGLNTIFIGGGTPSLLRADLWRRLLEALHHLFNLGPIRAGVGEFTVECNPESVTPALMTALADGGVTRVSLGAQSFNPRHLAALERRHTPGAVARALALAADAGITRRSVDLIYAVPGQTRDDVRADLDAALALDPPVEHVSAYCLTYEPNTPMTARAARGEFRTIDDDTAAAMQTIVRDTLADAGFEQYEVSNFARTRTHTSGGTGVPPVITQNSGTGVPPVGSDARSRHNLAYWRTEGWLAAGPSASAHVLTTDPQTGLPAGARWKNTPSLREWTAGLAQAGAAPIVDFEAPDPRRTLRERLMMGVRLAEGLDAGLVLDHADRLGFAGALAHAAELQRELGLLDLGADRWRPTARGFLFADAVAARLMAACRPAPP